MNGNKNQIISNTVTTEYANNTSLTFTTIESDGEISVSLGSVLLNSCVANNATSIKVLNQKSKGRLIRDGKKQGIMNSWKM